MQLNEREVIKESNNLAGTIEVICGPMFSGKTEELIRRINMARLAGLNVEIFNPALDTRYAENAIVSHNLNSLSSKSVDTSSEILPHENTQVVGIDEAQFFDDQLPTVCNNMAKGGIRVIVAGLDMDFEGMPFGPMPALMARADSLTKLHAVCVKCGAPALYSYRLVPSDSKILLGEKDIYEPLCRACYYEMDNYKKK